MEAPMNDNTTSQPFHGLLEREGRMGTKPHDPAGRLCRADKLC